MAALIYEFIEVLEKEAEQYSRLVEVGNLKRTHIIKGNLKEMGDANTIEEFVISKIRTLEKKRVELMNDMAMVLGLNKETVTVTQIEQALNNQHEEMAAVKKVKEKFTKSIEQLKLVNDENMSLISQSLDFAEFSLNLLQSAQGGPVMADYGNKQQSKRNDSFFDAKQ